MKKILSLTIFILILFSNLGAFKPKRVTCIAPASTGGGWNFTCRTPAAKLMRDLKNFRGNMKVINMAGAGGAIAYAHVVNKQKGNNHLIVAA